MNWSKKAEQQQQHPHARSWRDSNRNWKHNERSWVSLTEKHTIAWWYIKLVALLVSSQTVVSYALYCVPLECLCLIFVQTLGAVGFFFFLFLSFFLSFSFISFPFTPHHHQYAICYFSFSSLRFVLLSVPCLAAFAFRIKYIRLVWVCVRERFILQSFFSLFSFWIA